MVLQLVLPAEVEERLRKEAIRSGESAERVALRVLAQNLPAPFEARRAAAIALLEKWAEEDAQAAESSEAEEFFQNLDADRTSNRQLFPPELKGLSW
jgi:hypothetical protein